MSDTEYANVTERKFNGAAKYRVVATSRRAAKTAAQQYFRDVHGSRADTVVAEKTDRRAAILDDGESMFTVMVSDDSSGSLNDSETYEFGGGDE